MVSSTPTTCNLLAKMSQRRSPSEFLKIITGRPVVVKLNSGVDYRGNNYNDTLLLLLVGYITYYIYIGILACLDGYMNIALEQTEEYINGQV